MSVPLFSLLTLAGSVIAGLLGALTGLGGGVVLVPLLTLIFHVDIRYAIGASLISVIATSSGAAAAYVREGLFERKNRNVPGDRDHSGSFVRSIPCYTSPDAGLGCDLRSCVALFRMDRTKRTSRRPKLKVEPVVRQIATLRHISRWPRR